MACFINYICTYPHNVFSHRNRSFSRSFFLRLSLYPVHHGLTGWFSLLIQYVSLLFNISINANSHANRSEGGQDKKKSNMRRGKIFILGVSELCHKKWKLLIFFYYIWIQFKWGGKKTEKRRAKTERKRQRDVNEWP